MRYQKDWYKVFSRWRNIIIVSDEGGTDLYVDGRKRKRSTRFWVMIMKLYGIKPL